MSIHKAIIHRIYILQVGWGSDVADWAAIIWFSAFVPMNFYELIAIFDLFLGSNFYPVVTKTILVVIAILVLIPCYVRYVRGGVFQTEIVEWFDMRPRESRKRAKWLANVYIVLTLIVFPIGLMFAPKGYSVFHFFSLD